eukprot:11748684-Karenia_brevis.AAC.1
MYDGLEFYDGSSGQPLNKEMAIRARRAEMEFFRQRGVYSKVLRESAKGPVISTKWLDVNKGDCDSPDYRSRLVGREIKKDNRMDLFAATPPLESLRYIVSRCARNRHRGFKIMTNDVKRAYFYAAATREIYIEIPAEDWEPGDEAKVAKLKLSFYGTRDAAQNWGREVDKFFVGIGFRKGAGSPCNYSLMRSANCLSLHTEMTSRAQVRVIS